MKKTALLLLCASLVACSSSDKKDEIQPQPSTASTRPTQEQPKAQPAKEEPIVISMKKGDKRTAEASFSGDPQKGYVCFDFKDLELKAALELFSSQAGVTVEYNSKNPKKLTLRIAQPTEWREVMPLICRWTQTHVIRSQIQGRLELKEGFADPGPFLAKWNPNDTSPAADVSSTVPDSAPTGTQPSTPPPASGGNGAPGFDASDYQQPKQPGADRIDELRRGVNTNNSGVK